MTVENKNEILSIIQTISKEKIGYGNSHLYSMCQESINSQPQWTPQEILGDRMALIGRSYAASPERRYTWKKGTPEEQKKLQTSGDGTGDFFYNIADNMLEEPSQDLQQIKNHFQGKEYKFDGSKEDLRLLKESVNAVMRLNVILVDAIQEYDKIHNPTSLENMIFRNHPSFCTKFLHFHFPDAFFIMDSFSKDSAKYLFSSGCRTNVTLKYDSMTASITNAKAKEKEKGLISLLENMETTLWEEYQTPSKIEDIDESTYNEYLVHCEYAYKLGTIVHRCTTSQERCASIPRIVDTILLHVKKDQ